jgi:hypothetical protein
MVKPEHRTTSVFLSASVGAFAYTCSHRCFMNILQYCAKEFMVSGRVHGCIPVGPSPHPLGHRGSIYGGGGKKQRTLERHGIGRTHGQGFNPSNSVNPITMRELQSFRPVRWHTAVAAGMVARVGVSC